MEELIRLPTQVACARATRKWWVQQGPTDAYLHSVSVNWHANELTADCHLAQVYTKGPGRHDLPSCLSTSEDFSMQTSWTCSQCCLTAMTNTTCQPALLLPQRGHEQLARMTSSSGMFCAGLTSSGKPTGLLSSGEGRAVRACWCRSQACRSTPPGSFGSQMKLLPSWLPSRSHP